jgi:glycosyltransferase involved in cell wall biosynthesis
MRIAVFHNLPSGGAKRALLEWVRRLAGIHAIDVFSFSTAEHDYCDLRPFVRRHRTVTFMPRRLFGRPFGRLNHVQRLLDLDALSRLSAQLATEIDQGGYDVVFAHPCQYTFVPFILRSLKTPSIYFLHEPFGPGFHRFIERPKERRKRGTNQPAQDSFLAGIYHKRLWELQLSSLRSTTLLLSNSAFTQQVMRSAYHIESQVCPLGVNTAEFRCLATFDGPTSVISVGELAPRKGFDFVIRSLALLPEPQRPELRIAYNAEIPGEKQYLASVAEQAGVQVRFLGRLDTEQLVMEYNRAALCVYAPVLEPLGLVALEAMACGTPVVGVCEGGVAETVVDGVTGLLVARDPQACAEAVLSLLIDPSRRKCLGEQAQRHIAQSWTWERSVATVDMYLQQAGTQSAQDLARLS